MNRVYQKLSNFKEGDIVVNMTVDTYKYGDIGVVKEVKPIYDTLTVNYNGVNVIGVYPEDLLNVSTSWIKERLLKMN